MILTADYHTHTKYSHGKGTVLENAFSAKEKGLKEIAITDHGFSHPAFGLRKRKVDSLIADCKDATLKTGVKVLVGVESNLISSNGKCDLKADMYEKFDIYLMGIHKFVTYAPKTFFKLFLPNQFCNTFKCKPAKWLVKENTKALINAVEKNPIDVLTHINFQSYVDVKEVAKCCADNGTYLELNAKKEHISIGELEEILSTDVKFVIDSDAHSPSRVGEVSLVKNFISSIDFPMDRIYNIDGRTPEFRFNAFKNKSGV